MNKETKRNELKNQEFILNNNLRNIIRIYNKTQTNYIVCKLNLILKLFKVEY